MNMQPMPMPSSMSMSMPVSNVAAGPGVSVPMGMGINGMNVHNGLNPQQYAGNVGVPQPPMMMNMGIPMPMGMGGAMNAMQGSMSGPPPMSSADWRVQVTREHRANLIAKMYVVSTCLIMLLVVDILLIIVVTMN